MIYALNEAIAYSESKRSATHGKSGQDAGWKIYSVSYHGDLCVTAKAFGNYLNENYPDVKRVRDIRPEMVSGYVSSRANVTRDSALKIKSYLVKIEKVCNHQYGKCNWRASDIAVTVPDAPAKRVMSATDADTEKIVKAMRTGRSEGWKGPLLGRYAGLRVREACNVRMEAFRTSGGTYGYGQVVLRGAEDGCKGGRPRIVDVTSPEGREALIEVCRGVKPGAYIISKSNGDPLKPDSLNRSISRAVERAGLDPDEWSQNGEHAFRKAFSQECYDIARLAGASPEEALDYASKQLGHGEDRSDVDDVYVANQW
jgi:integrase